MLPMLPKGHGVTRRIAGFLDNSIEETHIVANMRMVYNDWFLGARVQRGMALLDVEYPGWREMIDLDKLNMGSTRNCTLGQLYGDFDDGLHALYLSRGTVFGFDAPSCWDMVMYTYGELTATWKAALSEL